MDEKKRRSPFDQEELGESPLLYDFDEEWDVEKAMQNGGRLPMKRRAPVQQQSQPRERRGEPGRREPQERRRDPRREQPQRRPAQRKKPQHPQQLNKHSLLLLAGAAVVVLLVLFGIIYGIVALVNKDSSEPTDPSASTTEPVSPDEIKALVARADALAAGYDYDGAITVLREYGDGWNLVEELSAANDRYTAAKSQLVKWEDMTNIPELSFSSLIVDTSRAFDGDEKQDSYNLHYTTVTEFKAILQALYDKGYVLVKMHDLGSMQLDVSGETLMKQGEIYLPSGKKPIVIAQDDVNYYESLIDSDGDHVADAGGDGFASRIVLDANGEPTCEYVDASGQTLTGDYDLVPILNSFIAEHPDFSYHGARGVLSVTGYQGVFGYRTHPDYETALGSDVYQQEIRSAQQVATALKAQGWEIASHSFGNINFGNADLEGLNSDIQKWANQVQPIVGETDILLYPSGDIGGVDEYSGEKFDALYSAGFRYFSNTDNSILSWMQYTDHYIRQSRLAVNGYRLVNGKDVFSALFDAAAVLDPARPTPMPEMN